MPFCRASPRGSVQEDKGRCGRAETTAEPEEEGECAWKAMCMWGCGERELGEVKGWRRLEEPGQVSQMG